MLFDDALSRLPSVMDNTMMLIFFFFMQIAQTAMAVTVSTDTIHTMIIKAVLCSPKYESSSDEEPDDSNKTEQKKIKISHNSSSNYTVGLVVSEAFS